MVHERTSRVRGSSFAYRFLSFIHTTTRPEHLPEYTLDTFMMEVAGHFLFAGRAFRYDTAHIRKYVHPVFKLANPRARGFSPRSTCLRACFRPIVIKESRFIASLQLGFPSVIDSRATALTQKC